MPNLLNRYYAPTPFFSDHAFYWNNEFGSQMCSQQLQSRFIWNEYEQYINVFSTTVYTERRQRKSQVNIIHAHQVSE